MNLGSPWMLLLLLGVAPAGWLMARARRLQREAACLLLGAPPEPAPLRLGRAGWLMLASLTCLTLALSRPQWNPQPWEGERRARDLVIALDVSRSMLAGDVAPNRLEAARIAILEALPTWAGQRIALVTFAGSAAVRVPLTLDHGFVRYLLERAAPSDMDLGSTSLQAALEKIFGTVVTGAVRGRCDLVLFTDGEDHLSDLDQTAALLAASGTRVLLIGLGDPVTGAPVPDLSGDGSPMHYQGAPVISRLNEDTLARLSAKDAKITCYPARTRPFDLVALYQQLVSGASGEVVAGSRQQVRYTEGYPFLLAVALALWLAASPWNWAALRCLLPLLPLFLLLPGCGPRVDAAADRAYRTNFQQGSELLSHAKEQSGLDLTAARGLLLEARESFLRAALLRPGDLESAREIAGASRLLRDWDTALETQRAAETKRQEKLGELVRRLEHLTQRQTRLSLQSAEVLARRLVPADADLANSSDADNEIREDEPLAGGREDRRFAAAAASEQQALHAGTASLADQVVQQRTALRQFLARAYGTTAREPPTELDSPATLLNGALEAQQQALSSLPPRTISWPKANTSFHRATGQMREALEALRALLPPVKDQDENARPPSQDNEGDAGGDSQEQGSADGNQKTAPASPGDFRAGLELQALPVPNYTPAEILAEESANQQQRARRKAARAGAKVEKNW